jgi:transcriptional regulator with XRE-family HTH domain
LKRGENLYRNFERLLNERGITAYRVAKDTKISTVTLSDWKKGKYTPKLDKIAKIANYFGVPLDEFIKTRKEEQTDA